jgi:hypothetical protein
MPEMSSRVQPSLRAQGRDFADALRTSTGIQGRLSFTPNVMGSIPTAPTSFLLHITGLAKTTRQQKAAIRTRMRWSVSNSEWHGWHTDAYPLGYNLAL